MGVPISSIPSRGESKVFDFIFHERVGRIFLALVFGVLAFYLFQYVVKFRFVVSGIFSTLIFIGIILGIATVAFGPLLAFSVAWITGIPFWLWLIGSLFPTLNPLFVLIFMVFWIFLAFITASQMFSQSKQKAFPTLILFYNVMIYVLLMIPLTSAVLFSAFQVDSPVRIAAESQQIEWEKIWFGVTQGVERAQSEAQRQINIATGNYEEGVESASQKPLGIFLENVGTNSPVKLGENLKIFGYLKAMTLSPSDKFAISANCYPALQPNNKSEASFIPEGKILYSGDYKSVDCEILSANIGPGLSQVVLETIFDFETNTFVKNYFMEQSVLRAYRGQGLDPLDEYKIVDKNPIAMYTGGPLMIGMRASAQQPVPLVEESKVGPRLDVTIDKNVAWPEGELLRVNKVVIYVPNGLKPVGDSENEPKCNPAPDGVSKMCEMNVEKLVISSPDKPLVLPVRFAVNTKIDEGGIQKIMGGSPLAVHSFKVDVEYTVRVRKAFDVQVDNI